MKRLAAIVICGLVLGGCAHQTRPLSETEELPDASSVVIEPPKPASPGSLWTQQQGSLFYDTKARSVGDIVTVAIYERASASKEAKTSTGRSSSMSADISKAFGLERNMATINKAIDPTALVSAGFDNDFEGSGRTSRKEDLIATLTSQVVEVYPNGNLRISGAKTVTVNNEKQIVKLTGIVRPKDISAQNVVNSENILDARIAYTGKGVLSDKQKPGWLMRLLDNVWPF
ncbi:flagellar basal body L-ring protein FlgH [Trichloromonas sp.]|uniref:flagellar basal body L-ring protein FlgH n=1 Tax=Trichloromonas sp. TaxID=3069249 RepID=UPI003D813FA8